MKKRIVNKLCAAVLCGAMVTSSLPLNVFATENVNGAVVHNPQWTGTNLYLNVEARDTNYTWDEIQTMLNRNGVATCDGCGEQNFTFALTTAMASTFNGIDFSKPGKANVRINAICAGRTDLKGAVDLNFIIKDTKGPTVNIPDAKKTQTIEQSTDSSMTADEIINQFTESSWISDVSSSVTVSYEGCESGEFKPDTKGEYKLNFKADDGRGNSTSFSNVVKVVSMDNERPTVIVPSDLQNQEFQLNGYTLTDADIVNVFVTRHGNKIVIKDNSGEKPTVTLKDRGTFSPSVFGNSRLTFTATDGSGNSTDFTINVNVVDSSVPTILETFLPSQPIVVEKREENISKDNILTVLGLDESIVNDNDPKVKLYCTDDSYEKFDATVPGDYVLTIYAKDTAGNESNKVNVNVKVADTTAPVVINVTYTPTADAPTNHSVLVTIEFSEELNTVRFGWSPVTENGKKNFKKWQKVFSENKTEELIFVDNFGNEEKTTVTVSNIDKEVPYVTAVEYSSESITNSNVQAIVSFSEDVTVTNPGWMPVKENGKNNFSKWQKVFSENGEYEFSFKDEAGNVQKHTVTINVIDKKAPEVSMVLSPNTFTNQNVTVTISATEPLNIEGWTKADIDGYIWKKVYETNETETVKVMDLAGNETIVDVVVDIIDKKAPEVSVTRTPDVITNSDVQVKITANEPIVIITEGWSQADTDGYIWKKTFVQNVTEDVDIVDRAENQITQTIVVDNIDKDAPIAESVTYSPEEFTTGNVVVTITYNESVEITAEGWTAADTDKKVWNKEFTDLAAETVIATDLAGNTTDTSVEVKNIDRIAPIVVLQYDHTQVEKGSEFTIPSAFGQDENAPYTLKAEMTAMFYGEAEDTATVPVQSVDTSKLGWYKLTYTATDMAGNVGSADCFVQIVDTTAPEVVDVKYSSKDMTYNNVVVTITYNEPVEITAEGWTATDDTKTIWEKEYAVNTKEDVVAADISGNTVTAEIQITNIDKEKPTVVTVEYSKTTFTNEDVTVKLIFNESVNVSSQGWAAADDTKNVWVKVFAQNGSENVNAADAAGNAISVDVKVANIDKVAPVIQGVENGKVYAEKVTATVTDENLEKVTVNGTEQKLTEAGLIFDKNGEYIVNATDKAGNVTEVKFKVEIKEVETIQPTIPTTDKNDTNKNDTDKTDDKSNTTAAKTSDNYNLVFPIVGVLAALFVMIGLFVRRRVHKVQ